MKSILKPLQNIRQKGYDMSTVFRDWVSLMLYALYRDDEKYLEIMGKYKNDAPMGEREADYFSQAFGALMIETRKEGKEMLGDIYMEIASNFSKKGMGQFFTPQHLSDAMAEMIVPESTEENQSILDPCCGSGRMLHSAAKKLPASTYFTGIDLDRICAHMSAINCTFFNMNAMILHGNSLSLEYYAGWQINRTRLGAIIRELTQDELDEYLEARKESFLKLAEEQSKKPASPVSEPAEKNEQLLLF